jgi:hypothetical protein
VTTVPDLSDDQLALELAERWRGLFPYQPAGCVWLIREGEAWVRDSRRQRVAAAGAFLRKEAAEVETLAVQLKTARLVAGRSVLPVTSAWGGLSIVGCQSRSRPRSKPYRDRTVMTTVLSFTENLRSNVPSGTRPRESRGVLTPNLFLLSHRRVTVGTFALPPCAVQPRRRP